MSKELASIIIAVAALALAYFFVFRRKSSKLQSGGSVGGSNYKDASKP
jgi:uncharacterized membrane protein